jgi:lipopolysaccharide transport system permease protein
VKIAQYFELIEYRALAELRRGASGMYLGMFWWVLEPLLYMAVFYVVFGLGLKKGGVDYVFYLLCGLVPWKWLDSTVRTSSGIVLSSVGLMRQVYFPKWLLPAYIVIANTYKFFIVLFLLMAALLLCGIKPASSWIFVPILVALQFFLVLGMSFAASSIVPLVPDLRFAVQYGMTILFFLSGVFFNIGELMEPVKSWLMWIPTVQLIDAYRGALLYDRVPDLIDMWRVLLCAGGFTCIGFIFLLMFDKYYPRLVR